MTRADARAVVFPMHEPDGLSGAERRVDRGGAGLRRAPGVLLPARPARVAGRGGAALPGRRRGRDQAAPARRAVHAARAGRARDRRGRARAARADPDPRGARDSRAGRRTRCELATEFPDARLILAHAAISDLAWLWHVLPDHPNVFIDTAWWNPADHIALFSLVDPSHIVWASDSPYGLPVLAAWTHARCALQAGVGVEALRWIMGGQIERLVTGQDPLWLGDGAGRVRGGAAPAAGPRRHPPDLGDRPRVRRRRPRRAARAGAPGLRGRRGRPARRRLRRRPGAARPLPRAPRPAAPGPPVPAGGTLHHRGAGRRPHPGGRRSRRDCTPRRRPAKRPTPSQPSPPPVIGGEEGLRFCCGGGVGSGVQRR